MKSELKAVSPLFDYKKIQITSNYGEVEGKVLKKTKTYAHVSSEASDDSIFTVASEIDGIQLPTAENIYVLTRSELIED